MSLRVLPLSPLSEPSEVRALVLDDGSVDATGTCDALPDRFVVPARLSVRGFSRFSILSIRSSFSGFVGLSDFSDFALRSEERRGGKECKSRGAPYSEKKKQ